MATGGEIDLLTRELGTVGFNRYAYAGNNPTTWTDPTGNDAAGEYGSLLSGISSRLALTTRVLGQCAYGALTESAMGLAISAIAGGVTVGGVAYDAITGCFSHGAGKVPRVHAPRRPSPKVAANAGEVTSSGAVRVGDVGSYAELQGRSVVGDGLDLHHMPQAAAGFTSRADGAAVALPRAEHLLTRTYGVRGARSMKADAGLGFRDVLAKDLWDLRAIGGSGYNQSIRDVISYYKTNFPELMAR